MNKNKEKGELFFSGRFGDIIIFVLFFLIFMLDVKYPLWAAVVQGMSEAFPISSSSHLLYLKSILGMENFWGPEGEVALHLGSLSALCTLFYKDVVGMVRGFFDALRGRPTNEQHFFWIMVLGTLPAVLWGGIFHWMAIDQWLHHQIVISAGCTIFFGALMYFMDRYSFERYDRYRPAHHAPPHTLFLIGCFQVLAFVPGVSRLGICLTGGRFLGYGIGAATHLAFLLGIPAMAAALVMKAPSFFKMATSNPDFSWSLMATMVGITYLINLPLMALFSSWTRQRFSLLPFALYRVLLGCSILFHIFLK